VNTNVPGVDGGPSDASKGTELNDEHAGYVTITILNDIHCLVFHYKHNGYISFVLNSSTYVFGMSSLSFAYPR
jgi:hypothetical protein